MGQHKKSKNLMRMNQEMFKRPDTSLSFDNPFVAYSLLKKLDVFEVMEDEALPKANYSSTAWGFKANPHYCDKHRAYFSRNPSSVFEEPKFITNYWKDHQLRNQVIPNIGRDLHPEVDPRSKGIKYKYKVDFGLEANIFFTHDLFYYRRQIGKQFSCLTQESNHIPGNDIIYKKELWAQALVDYGKTYVSRPQCFTHNKHFPKTWTLTRQDQCLEFFKELNNLNYQEVLKEEMGIVYSRTIGAGARGNGAVIPLNDQEKTDIRTLYQNGKLCGQVKDSNLIQYNIHNPLLVENHKLNIRAFLLIASTNPVIAYYHDGYVKVTLHEYDFSSHERKAHIINNKANLREFQGEEVLQAMGSSQVHKDELWTYEFFHEHLLEKGMVQNPNWLNDFLRPEFKKAMIHLVRMAQPRFFKKSSVFELYGLDFVMDENLNVWFSEASPMPLIKGSTEDTTQLMNQMLVGTFDVVLGLLRSRVKRMILYINDLTKEIKSVDIPNLEERREEFRELTKNRFESEFQPCPENSFQKIIDENDNGVKRYADLFEQECL